MVKVAGLANDFGRSPAGRERRSGAAASWAPEQHGHPCRSTSSPWGGVNCGVRWGEDIGGRLNEVEEVSRVRFI